MSNGDPYAERGVSKLKALFGPDVFDQFRDKVVLDFGCGLGGNAIEIAQNGCPQVIGLDILPHYIEKARRSAEAAGVADRCTFTSKWTEPVDVILSTDAFEHFAEPGKMLALPPRQHSFVHSRASR